MTINGEETPFREITGPKSVVMATHMSEVLDGLYDVEIVYTLHSPVVDAANGPDAQQQLRWTAWYDFWEDEYYTDATRPFGGKAPVRPLSISLAVAPEISGEIRSGGWIDYDHDRDRVPYENGNWYQPWEHENRLYLDNDLGESRPFDLRIGDERTRDDGALVVTLDVEAVQSRESEDYAEETPPGPWRVSDEINATLEKHDLGMNNDLGAVLDFAPGTFANVDGQAYERYRAERALPFGAVLGLAGLVTAASIGVFVFALRMRRRSSASLRTVSFAALPIAATAQSVLFWWAVMTMPGDDNRGWGAIAIGAVMLTAVLTQAIMVARRSGSPTAQGTGTRASSRTAPPRA